MAHLSNILDISGPVEEMFERSPEIPNFGTTNPFRCRHVVTKFPQLDLRTPAKEGSQRLTKAYPRPALDLTMAPWGMEQHPGSLGHDMSWPKIDRKIQKIELALEALLAQTHRDDEDTATCSNGCCTPKWRLGQRTRRKKSPDSVSSRPSIALEQKQVLKTMDPLPDTNHAECFRTPGPPHV